MKSNDVIAAMQAARDVAKASAPMIPAGPGQTIATIVGIALDAAVGIAEQGLDPISEIARMLSSEEGVAGVHKRWQADIDAKFGKSPMASDEGDEVLR